MLFPSRFWRRWRRASAAALLSAITFLFLAASAQVLAASAQGPLPDTGWLTVPEHPDASVRLSVTGERAGNRVNALLEVSLAKDWKTYWRSPGEGGIAPELEWQESSNIQRVEWHWPLPKRYNLLGFNTLGYEGELAFPLVLHLDDPAQPAVFKGVFTLPSCTYICVLTDFDLTLALDNPGTMRADPERSHRFQQAYSQVPRDTGALAQIDAYWQADSQRLQVLATAAHAWQNPDVLLDDVAGALAEVQLELPRIEVQGEQLLATFELSSWRELPDLTNIPIQVTVFDESLAEEVAVAPSAGPAPVTAQPAMGLLPMLGFALLGGLILNLMPCVLQVLGEQLLATLELSSWRVLPNLTNLPIYVTVFDETLTEEVAVTPSAGPAPVTAQPAMGLLPMLGFALLGGLILNLMPCVLPVLGLKLHSVLNAGTENRRMIRGQFLASAAGILFSFWLLAGFLWILKITGQAVGWGIQFHNTAFIVFMVAVTWLFALNLLGVWALRLPGAMNQWLANRGDHSHRGHFVQGMFATLLATPCSAPFLGTAVAFALGADTLQLLVIFTALGLGMALPWLTVAAMPRLATYLPKPGRWMSIMQVVFGIMLLLTSAWLLSLLVRLWGGSIVAVTAALLVSIPLVLIGRRYGAKVLAVTLSTGIPVITAAVLLTTVGSGRFSLPESHPWQPFEQAAITEQVNAGHVVFVDVTADWCITCKANEMGVLLQQPVYDALHAEDIVLQRADWTTPSSTITDYLQSHGRAGVPFNVVYGPGAPEGVRLPVLLRERDVMAALQRARGQ